MISRIDEILHAIRQQGLRLTIPRKGIIEVLHGAGSYLSADDIYLKVIQKYPGIGLATIYRTLVMLSDIGVLTKFEFGEGKARYELAESSSKSVHHHVLVCTSCQKAIKYSDFTEDEKNGMKRNEEYLEKKYKFSIARHVVQFYGVCNDCHNKEKADKKSAS